MVNASSMEPLGNGPVPAHRSSEFDGAVDGGLAPSDRSGMFRRCSAGHALLTWWLELEPEVLGVPRRAKQAAEVLMDHRGSHVVN